LLRDFIRTVVFERFPVSAGMCAGVAQALLVAWGITLASGPAAVRPAAIAGLAVVLAAAHGWATPRVGLSRRVSSAAHRGARLYLALGFSSIVLAGVGVACTLLFGGIAALLAMTGLPEAAGLAVFRAGSLVVALVTSGALAWGFVAEPSCLEVTRRRVSVRGLASALRGLRLVHLSDLHIGNGFEAERIATLVERVQALDPDLVAITGDLFDHDPAALEEGARGLGRLRARLGVFAVLGNHDTYTGCEAVAAALARHAPAIELLRGRSLRLATAAPLHVAGLDDPGHDWTAGGGRLPALDELAAKVPSDEPVILLVHRPDAFPQAAELGFPLVLAGHFHGGQVAVPGLAARFNAASLLTPFHRGEHRLGGSALYVSRGLGFAGPRIRIASRPEIALLELEPAGKAQAA
jgi:predicted MPP superfamily phosphohydrolase